MPIQGPKLKWPKDRSIQRPHQKQTLDKQHGVQVRNGWIRNT